MSGWAIAWLGWGLYFAIVEGLALANRRRSDTLSEHVWAFLGLRRGPIYRRRVTGWTKVRRIAVGLFMAALSAHFLIGSDTAGNWVLIGSATVLAAVVLGTGAVRYRRARCAKTSTKETNGSNP